MLWGMRGQPFLSRLLFLHGCFLRRDSPTKTALLLTELGMCEESDRFVDSCIRCGDVEMLGTMVIDSVTLNG